MFRTTFFPAILAGVAAGLIYGLLLTWKLTPLILAAEAFEQGHSHGSDLERYGFTMLTAMLTGAGFSALMTGLSILAGSPMNRSNGLIWGLCGFLAFSLAPAIGLPPKLPGMPVPPLHASQLWWVATVMATAIGLWLCLIRKERIALLAGIFLIALPHIIGAPAPEEAATEIPANLAARFVANALATNLLFWCMIGYLSAAATGYWGRTRQG